MNYLPFIAGSYGITLVLALVLGIGAAMRLARAKRGLRAVDRLRGAGADAMPRPLAGDARSGAA